MTIRKARKLKPSRRIEKTNLTIDFSEDSPRRIVKKYRNFKYKAGQHQCMLIYPMLLDTRGADPDGHLTLGGQEAPFAVFSVY